MIRGVLLLRARIGHPGDVSLQRFADGETTSSVRSTVVAHLTRCQRCRDRVTFARDVGHRIRALPVPPASATTIARVLAERAGGERMILPPEPKPSVPARSLTRFAIAAALLTIVVLPGVIVVVMDRLRERDLATTAVDMSARMSGDVVSFLGLLPTAAYAQGVTDPGRSDRRFEALDGARVRAGTWEYEFRELENGRTSGPGERGVVRVAHTQYRGANAWRVQHAWLGHPNDMVETTLFDATSLRPLYRHARNVSKSRFTVEQHFVGDSLIGSMQATAPVRPMTHFRRGLPRKARPFGAGDGFALVFFQSVPLTVGWTSGISLLGWGAMTADLYYPARIRVLSTERISVPAGVFDCWQVMVTAHGHTKRLWVRRSDGVVVKTAEATRPATRTNEVVLISERLQ